MILIRCIRVVLGRVHNRTDFGYEIFDFSKANPGNVIFNHRGGFEVFMPANENEWKRILAGFLGPRRGGIAT